jgi:hypothetical protein
LENELKEGDDERGYHDAYDGADEDDEETAETEIMKKKKERITTEEAKIGVTKGRKVKGE